MQPTELMNVALKAGEMMLTSGAEIYRVEETIVRICNSYNIKCESFVLPTGIFISIENEDGSVNTGFRRIRVRNVDLNRIDSINSISRSLQTFQPDYATVMEKLNEVRNMKRYSFPARTAATAIGSFAFTIIFRGSLYDGIAALCIGSVSYLIKEFLTRRSSFQFFENFIAGILAGFLSIAAYKYHPYLNLYKIIIGSIMLYLPGVSITNGIKDALYGDLVASWTRLGEAILLVAVLAAGVGVGLSFLS
jgi:uncharacterized membrane protein YjjP (DUF1212 family)